MNVETKTTSLGSLATAATPSSANARAQRLDYLDNLRSFLTVLVVGHHAALAYTVFPTGWTVSDSVRTSALTPFISLNAMFFMGLFFFLAGFFTVPSLDRKGTKRFLADRCLRLGCPSLAWLAYNLIARGSFEFWHMWFACDLLLISLLYSGFHALRGGIPRLAATAFPRIGTVLLLVVLLALATATVRGWYPIGTWVSLLGVFPLEPAHAVQYVVCFTLGVVTQRRGWLSALTRRHARLWGGVAAAAVALFVGHRVFGIPDDWFRTGGWNWQSAVYSSFEALICVSLSIAMLAFFRERCSSQSPLSRTLASNAYGIYFIHFVPVLLLQRALLLTDLPALLKFSIVWAGGFVLSLFLSMALLRSTSIARRIF